MRRIAIVAIVLLVPATAHARPGDLDRGFGDHGRVGFAMYGTGGTPMGLHLVDGLRPLMDISAYTSAGAAPTWLQLPSLGRVRSSVPMQPPSALAIKIVSGYALWNRQTATTAPT